MIPGIKPNCTQVTDDVTNDTPGDTGEVKQEAESEPQAETLAEEHKGKGEMNMEAAESSEAPEAAEGDLPEEEVMHLLCPSVCNPGVAQVC